jgi:uncharacterized protein
MLIWLTPLFAFTALIYASVGFAGGSTYTALLVLAGLEPDTLKLVSLSCNIVVALGGVWRFAAAREIPWRRTWPLLVLSVPAAWLGGIAPLDKATFILLLGLSLALAGILLLAGPAKQRDGIDASNNRRSHLIALALAAPLGLLSGLVGIGGGIFLAPILHLIRWDTARRIAGAAALFILANSIAGLAGQVGKTGSDAMAALSPWWPLLLAVLVAGQLGSFVGARHLPPVVIRRVTGAVVLLAAVRLLTT